MSKLIFLFVLTFHLPLVHAADLTGKFTFDWLSPKSSSCQKISSELNKKLASFKCISSEGLGGEEQPPLFACTSKNSKQDYLVYESLGECKAARDAILSSAN